MIQYYQIRAASFPEIEKKLSDAGYSIGVRIAEMIGVREKVTRRETRIVAMLQVSKFQTLFLEMNKS